MNKAKEEGCAEFKVSAFPLTLSIFTLGRKPH